MKHFEYKTELYYPTGVTGGKVDAEALDNALNAMGRDGWEFSEHCGVQSWLWRNSSTCLCFQA